MKQKTSPISETSDESQIVSFAETEKNLPLLVLNRHLLNEVTGNRHLHLGSNGLAFYITTTCSVSEPDHYGFCPVSFIQ